MLAALTPARLQQMFPRAVDSYSQLFDTFTRACLRHGITTPRRLQAFFAQISVESGGLRFREENLNYSAERLLEVFPRYFRDVNVHEYARQPQKIANRVYANRMGNGNEASGDGWRFRGAGWLQLTGRSNYTAFARDYGMTIEQAVEHARTLQGAADVSAWYWERARCNVPADAGDIDEVSRLINAGPGGSLSAVHGLQERRDEYRRAQTIFV